MAKSPEEQALDDLITPVSGQIDQTIKVFPDRNALDPNKTKGREHRALLRTVVTSLMAWVRSLINYSTLTAYEATIPATAVSAWQEEDGTKRKLTWQGLVNAFKAIFGYGYKPYNVLKSYEVGETYLGAGGLYEVLIGWTPSPFTLEAEIPLNRVKLLSNLDTPFSSVQLGSGLNTVGSSFVSTLTNITYDFALNATPGQSIAIGATGPIRRGKRVNVRFVWNGITAVTTGQNITGSLAIPNGALQGDVVVCELYAFSDGQFTLTRKYIEGKESTGSGSSYTKASTGLPASTVLSFQNPFGESHDPLIQDGPLTFTLGNGPHVAMVTKRQRVISDGVNPITFSGPFTYQYLGFSEDDTLEAGDYEFVFAYNQEGTVSVSVPGSGVMPEPVFTPIAANQYGLGKPATALNTINEAIAYLLTSGTYTPPVSDGPSVINPQASSITDSSMLLSWTNPS